MPYGQIGVPDDAPRCPYEIADIMPITQVHGGTTGRTGGRIMEHWVTAAKGFYYLFADGFGAHGHNSICPAMGAMSTGGSGSAHHCGIGSDSLSDVSSGTHV
jgi:hypothetical protein